jgi:hypothetical protein
MHVFRWGHCSVELNGDIWLIAGYGGSNSTHSRLGDVLCFSSSATDSRWRTVVVSGETFSPRTYGACVKVTVNNGSASTCIMFHGGRASPSCAFGETFLLHVNAPNSDFNTAHCRWQMISREGPGLYRHAMVALEHQTLAIGGLGPGAAEGPSISVWLLDHSLFSESFSAHSNTSCDFLWRRVITAGEVPPPLHSLTATLVKSSSGSSIIVIGGASSLGRCSRHIFILDTETLIWRRSRALLPLGLMSHTSESCARISAPTIT